MLINYLLNNNVCSLIKNGFPNSSIKGLSYGLGAITTIYILYPSLKLILGIGNCNTKAKRIDQYAVGLVNVSTVCFANSAIQALASLNYFTSYLNEFLSNCKEMVRNEQFTNGRMKNSLEVLKSFIPLTYLLAETLASLQELVDVQKAISVIPLIKLVENKSQLNFSRGQHDANEFIQLLLDLLAKERNLLMRICNEKRISFTNSKIPFEGSTGQSLTCLKCHHSSKIQKQKFTIFTLPLPQQLSANLQDVMYNEQVEEISDYSCLVCQIKAILNNEKSMSRSNITETEKSYLHKLAMSLSVMHINDELPLELEIFVKQYIEKYLNSVQLNTTVLRKITITDYPKILSLHLSRSIYNGMVSQRNSCSLSFEEFITSHAQNTFQDNALKTEKMRFQLQSVVNHRGSHTHGHYQCYRRKPVILKRRKKSQQNVTINTFPEFTSMIETSTVRTQKQVSDCQEFKIMPSIKRYPFWKLSDTNTSEAKLADVLNETKSVFMLFYELQIPKSTQHSPNDD